MRTRAAVPLIVLAVSLGACTRYVPRTLPSSSAASTEAAEATPVIIGRALREEPPLPGESIEGWEALEPTTRGEGGHAHAH